MKTNKLLTPIPMLAAGLILGAAARLFDIYFPNLGGDILSDIGLDLGGNPDRHIQSHKESGHAKHFSVLHGDVVHLLSYSHAYPRGLRLVIYPWLDGVCMSFSGHGIFGVDDQAARSSPKDHRSRDPAFSIASSILLFDRLRVYDFILDGLLAYFIFFKKIKRCS